MDDLQRDTISVGWPRFERESGLGRTHLVMVHTPLRLNHWPVDEAICFVEERLKSLLDFLAVVYHWPREDDS